MSRLSLQHAEDCRCSVDNGPDPNCLKKKESPTPPAAGEFERVLQRLIHAFVIGEGVVDAASEVSAAHLAAVEEAYQRGVRQELSERVAKKIVHDDFICHECGSQVGGLMHDTACGHDSSHNGENCSKCYASAASAGKVAIEAARREGAAEAWREATTIAGRADCTDGGFYGQPCLCNRCSLVRVFEQRAPEVKR